MSDVYRISEDAIAEKSLVITKDANVQYSYVANYLWFFFVEGRKFHIVACFKETPQIEYRASVKIWFKDEQCSHFERTESFSFNQKKGDDYDIMDPEWLSIEVTFRVTKLYGEEYIGPAENESVEERGMIVIIENQKIFLNLERVILQSEVLDNIHMNSDEAVVTLFEVNPEVFLEMLRVLNPPYKRISSHYFTEFLLLACRFRINNLVARLDEFAKTPQYDPNWFTKVAWRKMQRVLREDPCFSVQVLENFRVRRRQERPLRRVTIRDPEIQSVHPITNENDKKSCFGSICDYLSNRKTRIIYILLSFLFFENIFLLVWFLCIYKQGRWL